MIVDVERVGHLGVCVGRADDGRAVLVRHALPGERVRVEITESRSSFLRADAVEVLLASPHRVVPRCPWSGPGRCGGCDWQHVELAEQRRLKASVVAEQLRRLGGVDVAVTVEPVPGDIDGLGWRTRLRLAVDRTGRAGLRRHRSRAIELIGDCPIAHPGLDVSEVVRRRWLRGSEVEIGLSAASDGHLRRCDPEASSTQVAAGRSWEVPPGGFWQVHPGAADLFVNVVDDLLGPLAGDRLVDLYAGVGLFAGSLTARHGLGPSVAVEAAPQAVSAAERNLADLPVRVVEAAVEPWVAGDELGSARPDLVVLDPPRRGAGRTVVEAIVAARPRAVAYVACDPAALGRDTAIFAAGGWRISGLRAFDAFPMTAHVETIACFTPHVEVK